MLSFVIGLINIKKYIMAKENIYITSASRTAVGSLNKTLKHPRI